MKRFSCSHVSPLNSLSHKQGHSPFLSLTLGIRIHTPECTPPHMPSVNKLFPTTILIIIVFLFLCSAFSLLFPIQWMVVLYVPTHHHYSHNPFFFLSPHHHHPSAVVAWAKQAAENASGQIAQLCQHKQTKTPYHPSRRRALYHNFIALQYNKVNLIFPGTKTL